MVMKYTINLNILQINSLSEVEGKTVLEFLQLFKVSKKNMHQLFQNKYIKINNQVVNQNYILSKDDRISIKLQEFDIDYAPDDKSATVVYEDDLICVVHKDPGIIVHDDQKDKKGTLANQVARYYQDSGYSIPVRYIHRLDEETQGLVLFCKVPLFQPWFDEELADKRIVRTYHAITFNKPSKNKMVINKPLGRDRHNAKKMRVSMSGKEAVTNINLLNTNANYSLVECKLETGRTHQIRVHLSSINCPIVNDELYGYKTNDYSCMGLFAVSLSWIDPFTKEKRIVEDPLCKNINL